MSLIPVTLTNATDTWVSQSRPDTNYSTGVYLRMRAGTLMYSYIYFTRPFPLGATITSATLHLRTISALTGTRTVTARRTSSQWRVSRLTYNTRPSTDSVTASVTKTGGASNTVWDIDVTSIMQQVSNGAVWYGLRLDTSDTSQLLFGSAQSTSHKPTLDVTWTDAPQAPSTLSPAGGRFVSLNKPILRFDFTDHIGNTTLNAVRVEMNGSNAWTSPTFDTGTVLTSEPQLDLNAVHTRKAGGVVTTAGSTTVTASGNTFGTGDVGGTITGTGIPAGATVASYVDTGHITISAAATASTTGNIVTVHGDFIGLNSAGLTYYWRAQVQDGAGVWSDWSDAATFGRLPKGILTITNPASVSPIVTEATPPITWTFTGTTQAAYQVIVVDTEGVWIHTSGKITGTETTYTLPKGIIHDNITYMVYVRVWDTISRESTPNDPVYVQAGQTFTYNLSGTVAVVSVFAGTDLTPVPGIQLDWTRSTAPDAYTIVRDNHVIDSVLAEDVLVSGIASRYTDYGANPQVSHVWTVRAVVNGVTSGSNPTVTKTLAPVGIWLVDADRSISVQLVGSDNGTWANGEDAAVYTPIGGSTAVRVTQALRGFEGNITGEFISFGSTNVQTSVVNMYKLKQNAGSVYWLTFSDMTIPVVIGNVTIAPLRGLPIRKQVSFDFWQVGNLPFKAAL